jgi:hypothetical protein
MHNVFRTCADALTQDAVEHAGMGAPHDVGGDANCAAAKFVAIVFSQSILQDYLTRTLKNVCELVGATV